MKKTMGKINLADIVEILIQKFETELVDPEHIAIKQLDSTRDMYLIAKGSCIVVFNEDKPASEKKELGNIF